ncbi:MAG: hypothetical protein HY721_14530 [Planctomycetes bacterium]|nr:hypothetical protein [Planctomycetota bacterium]
MTEENKPAEPEAATETPGTDLKAEIAKLPLAEKVLAPIAVLVVIGWLIAWTRSEVFYYALFKSWFATLSFLGALAVAVLVGLKLFGIRPLPPAVDRLLVPVASLLPVAGYLIEIISPIYQFFTVGGSIALAYISATTYWRKHIPAVATKPLGEAPPAEPAEPGAAPPAA